MRSTGRRLLIGYKLVKGGLVLVAAIVLTFAAQVSERVLETVVEDLAEHGATLRRLARALRGGDASLLHEARLVAWLDGTTTCAEGVLLLLGKRWADNVVLAALAGFFVAELVALERAPSLAKSLVLLVNALAVAFLWRRRSRARGPVAT